MIANQIRLMEEDAISICDAAGDFYLVPIVSGRLTLPEIKQCCEDFEQRNTHGRFLDADLNDRQGNSVSSGKLKSCFFCSEKPAIICRHEKTHDLEELRTFMFQKMNEFCQNRSDERIIKQLSTLAEKAIFAEISLSPKPGLVDLFSQGSHTDMNFQTFMNSTLAISPWFEQLVHEGFVFQDDDFTKALPIIRNIGLQMEAAMFKTTQGINTQKGIIFLMGLSLFASGVSFSKNGGFVLEEFRQIIKLICADLVQHELKEGSLIPKSHGADVFMKYGFSGARGEAESGFQTVFEFGLPELSGTSEYTEIVLFKCFLAIAAHNNDTNILYRSNRRVLATFKKLCTIALTDFNTGNYTEVIDFCKNENISPGGSADLLAVTIFIASVIQSENF